MTEDGVLRFRGRPRHLEAVVQIPQDQLRQPVSLEVAGQERAASAPTVALVPFSDETVRVQLSFSRETKPGEYKGEIRAGNSLIPFVAEVEPTPHLKISPRSLRLEAAGGSSVAVQASIANDGNCMCEIAPTFGVGLFPVGGVENALGAAYRSPDKDGKRWIDRVGDNLAKEYGGLIRVRVSDGGITLNPGEVRKVSFMFRLPQKLLAGRIYTGTLSLYNLSWYVEVRPPGEPADGNIELATQTTT